MPRVCALLIKHETHMIERIEQLWQCQKQTFDILIVHESSVFLGLFRRMSAPMKVKKAHLKKQICKNLKVLP